MTSLREVTSWDECEELCMLCDIRGGCASGDVIGWGYGYSVTS